MKSIFQRIVTFGLLDNKFNKKIHVYNLLHKFVYRILSSKLNNDIIYQLTHLNYEVGIIRKMNNIFYSIRTLWIWMFFISWYLGWFFKTRHSRGMVCQKMKNAWYKGSLIVTDKMSIHYFIFTIIIHHKPFGTVWRNMVRHQPI